jgi:hypothetical protein
MQTNIEMSERLQRLEHRLRRTQFAAGAAVAAAIAVAGAKQLWATAAVVPTTVLRARGLIIEDVNGRPRLLLGAPTPRVAQRTRTEEVNGIVLLGENGSDRVVIAYPGIEPQVLGKVEKRSIAVPSAGLLINDADGNERAGFGVSDDGKRVSLGLDYADRDAMGLLVSPAFSGLAVFARDGERNDQVTAGVGRDGTATLKVADVNGDEHFMVEAGRDSVPRLFLLNPATHKLENVTSKLVPTERSR